MSKAGNIVLVHDDITLLEFVLSVYDELMKKYGGTTVMGVGSQDFYNGNVPHFLTYSCVTSIGFVFARYMGIAGIFINRHITLEIEAFMMNVFLNKDGSCTFQVI